MKKIKLAFALIKNLFVSPTRILKHNMHFLIEQDKKKETASYGYAEGLPAIDIRDLLGEIDVSIHNVTFLDGTSRLTDIAILKSLA